MDHGILNTPIGSRARGGSIDAQIDRWKAETAAERRAYAKSVNVQRRDARALVTAATDEQIAPLATKAGMTIKQARANLRSQCIANPSLVIRHFTQPAP